MEYRIVSDNYSGYEVQIRRWWFPFWCCIDSNTHTTTERAQSWAEAHAHKNIKYLGKWYDS